MRLSRTPKGIAVVRLHYDADPTLSKEMVATLRSGYSSEAHWRKEMEIEYDALGGALVYPEFNEEIHVIAPERIPTRGCRYMSIDPHPRSPIACLWALVDPWGDVYIYRELWPSVSYGDYRTQRDDEDENIYPLKYYAEAIAVLEGNRLQWQYEDTEQEYAKYIQTPNGEKLIFRLMDQAGKGFQASAYGAQLETFSTKLGKYGIQCRDPKKAHQSGEDAVRDWLRPRHHHLNGLWPRVHISADCVELIAELKNHRYRLTKRVDQERDLKQDRSAFRCHMVDNLRYLANSPVQYIRGYDS